MRLMIMHILQQSMNTARVNYTLECEISQIEFNFHTLQSAHQLSLQ